MKKYYAVVGRMCGDDDDSVMVYQTHTPDEAQEQFHCDLWALEDGSTPEQRQLAEANGEGVFVNLVLISDTPIRSL